MSGVQKIRLHNLNPNINNALIIGIIIAKNNPRLIGSKKKNGDSRGVTSFTLRDSDVDTINVDVWGSEYFILTFYERFLVGDVVEISSPKICVKSGANEMYRPQVSSPFYLSLNEGMSDVTIHNGDSFGSYLPLLHIPTKPSSGYCGLAEVLKLPEKDNTYVDLLVVVKAVKAAKSIKTKAGADMSVRSVEIVDNTTPASLTLDMFDIDTIQRAEDWRPLESVLFISDARVSWRSRGVTLQVCARSVITHQPHTADAEALRLYLRNQNNTRGGEAAAWAAWSGERTCSASVAQVRDRLGSSTPFCASLHALLTHLDLDQLVLSPCIGGGEAVAWAAWSGERTCSASVAQVRDRLGSSTPFCTSLHALLTHLDLDQLVLSPCIGGGEAVAWVAWSGERTCSASVAQVRDRLGSSTPFCTSLHALLTHLDLDQLVLSPCIGGGEAVAWAAWSGERTCSASVAQVRDRLGSSTPFCTSLHALLTHLDLDQLVLSPCIGGGEAVAWVAWSGERTCSASVAQVRDRLGSSTPFCTSLHALLTHLDLDQLVLSPCIGGGEAAAWAAWSGERTCSASVAQVRDRLGSSTPLCTSLHALLTHLDLDQLVLSPCIGGGEAAAWAAWSGERTCSASVAQVRDRLGSSTPFCASLHALLTHLDLDQLVQPGEVNNEEVTVRFADHTGELSARLPHHILEESFGYSIQQLKTMSADDRAGLRWKYLLEQCYAKLAASPPRLIVLTLRRASPADPIPLY